MRLVLDPRARRWLRRLPRRSLYSLAELVLLAVLAVQCARLVWAVATPVDPLGDWRPTTPVTVSESILRSFDPFFRGGAAAGPLTVTTLDLKLFGVRADQASGRGAAIVGTPDGRQQSYAVGEEIMPGVVLDAVAFDNITVRRGGVREQLFLDQSQPAVTVAPPPVSAPQAVTVPPPPAPAASPISEIQITPRRDGGQVTGFAVDPQGVGTAFRQFGFLPGDVVLSVNGVAAASASPDQLRAALGQSGGEVVAEVERGGQRVTLRGVYSR